MARLPIVGGDADQWGAILNDYLSPRLDDAPSKCVDLDAETASGWYYYSPDAVGVPGAGRFGMVLVIGGGQMVQTWQLAFEHGSDIIYARRIGWPWLTLTVQAAAASRPAEDA